MGVYSQLHTPSSSQQNRASNGEISFQPSEGDIAFQPSGRDMEQPPLKPIEEKVIVVEDDDCLGWHGMMGKWPIITCLIFLVVGVGVGVCFSLLVLCQNDGDYTWCTN